MATQKVMSVQIGTILESRIADDEGAKDVKVTVRYHGKQYRGTCAVVPDRFNGGFQTFGDAADMWISSELIAEIWAFADGDERREVLHELAGTVVAAAERDAG